MDNDGCVSGCAQRCAPKIRPEVLIVTVLVQAQPVGMKQKGNRIIDGIIREPHFDGGPVLLVPVFAYPNTRFLKEFPVVGVGIASGVDFEIIAGFCEFPLAVLDITGKELVVYNTVKTDFPGLDQLFFQRVVCPELKCRKADRAFLRKPHFTSPSSAALNMSRYLNVIGADGSAP